MPGTTVCSSCLVELPISRAWLLPRQSSHGLRAVVCLACWQQWLKSSGPAEVVAESRKPRDAA
jgi:hypothetical protein